MNPQYPNDVQKVIDKVPKQLQWFGFDQQKQLSAKMSSNNAAHVDPLPHVAEESEEVAPVFNEV